MFMFEEKGFFCGGLADKVKVTVQTNPDTGWSTLEAIYTGLTDTFPATRFTVGTATYRRGPRADYYEERQPLPPYRWQMSDGDSWRNIVDSAIPGEITHAWVLGNEHPKGKSKRAETIAAWGKKRYVDLDSVESYLKRRELVH